jgi:hypothetical protein
VKVIRAAAGYRLDVATGVASVGRVVEGSLDDELLEAVSCRHRDVRCRVRPIELASMPLIRTLLLVVRWPFLTPDLIGVAAAELGVVRDASIAAQTARQASDSCWKVR